MVDFAQRARRARHRRRSPSISSTPNSTGEFPIARRCSRPAIGGDRGRRAARGERARARCSSAANRWAAASPRRSRPPIRIFRLPVSCCSAIRCIRPAGPTSGATRICRPSAGRCCSFRAAATRSARRPSSRRVVDGIGPPRDLRRRRRRPLVQAGAQRIRRRRRRSTTTSSGRSSSGCGRFMGTVSSMTPPSATKP